MEESAEFGMEVGITTPFHYQQHGLAGIGLCMGTMSTVEFDRLWRDHGDEILEITHAFDQLARNDHMGSIYPLTPS